MIHHAYSNSHLHHHATSHHSRRQPRHHPWPAAHCDQLIIDRQMVLRSTTRRENLRPHLLPTMLQRPRPLHGIAAKMPSQSRMSAWIWLLQGIVMQRGGFFGDKIDRECVVVVVGGNVWYVSVVGFWWRVCWFAFKELGVLLIERRRYRDTSKTKLQNIHIWTIYYVLIAFLASSLTLFKDS